MFQVFFHYQIQTKHACEKIFTLIRAPFFFVICYLRTSIISQTAGCVL